MDSRCEQTIDIEECIIMSTKPKKIRATITYNSGRTEVIAGALKNNGEPPKTFSKAVAEFKRFPTVVSVEVERF